MFFNCHLESLLVTYNGELLWGKTPVLVDIYPIQMKLVYAVDPFQLLKLSGRILNVFLNIPSDFLYTLYL